MKTQDQPRNQALETKIAELKAHIHWMETSKFWKLRSQYFQLKKKTKDVIQKILKPNNSFFTQKSDILHAEMYENQPPSIKLQNPRILPENPSVLLIVEESLPQCFRYRVMQKIEQIQKLNCAVQWVSWKDKTKEIQRLIHLSHIIIVYRVPAFPDVIETIQYARSLNKITIFDIDDLIFDIRYYPEPFENLSEQISYQEYENLKKGTVLYQQSLSLCDYACASTQSLASMMAPYTQKKKSFVHRNALDGEVLDYIALSIPRVNRDFISILYGTGTKTHDKDFAIAAKAIANILEKYSHVRLTIVGYLTLPKILNSYHERIDKIGFLDKRVYWEFLKNADISIAPLTESIFNDCKSEIKWLEAAVFEIPSVVTPTQNYKDVLVDQEDVFFADSANDWFNILEKLVIDQNTRKKVGALAQQKALSLYSLESLSSNLNNIFQSIINDSEKTGTAFREENLDKVKILFVNVLYPPQTFGGATTLLYNQLKILNSKYSDKYQISVFTTDINNSQEFDVTEYEHDGIPVTRLNLPIFGNQEWEYQNDATYHIFKDYLEFSKPDLIHFHCIQRLTASVLEAAYDLNIPYLVTVHDAWWICDHQFLLDSQGKERSKLNQSDPLIVVKYDSDINQSIIRRQHLYRHLSKSQKIIAVSDFQAKLYRLNGFDNVVVNRNGISPFQPLKRQIKEGIVRIGYAGGICTHKGFYYLKEIVNKANLKNTEFFILKQPNSSLSNEKATFWGTSPVYFLDNFEHHKMPEFFSQVDVLIAPSLCSESFGLITREASWNGLWVIAADKGGLAEDIRNEINGNIFNPDNEYELLNILQAIDKNPSFYHQSFLERDNIKTISEQVQELTKIYDLSVSKINLAN